MKQGDPLPEKPHQYNRVCDLVAPNNQGCEAGNKSLAQVSAKGDPLPEKPHQYNRVCDLVAPNNQGCEAGNKSLAQVKRSWVELPTCGSPEDTRQPPIPLNADSSNGTAATCKPPAAAPK